MTTRMERTTHAGDGELPAHDFKITQDVPLVKLAAVARTKRAGVVMLRQVPIKQLAKLNAHWYEALFVALAYDPKEKTVQVHLLAREVKQFLKAEPGVQGGDDDGLQPRFLTPDGLPVYEPGDLLRA